MVSGYVQNGMLDEAKRVFDGMPGKNSVLWNAIIAGYMQLCLSVIPTHGQLSLLDMPKTAMVERLCIHL